MPKVNYVKKARKDYSEAGIKRGDSYYWWKFPYGPKIRSATHPKRSQLTQSEFLAWYYDLQDHIADLTPEDFDQIEAERDAVVDEVDDQIGELEGRLDNMPDGLREESDSGQLLQERIDLLTEWRDSLESADADMYREMALDGDIYDEDADERDPDELEDEALAAFWDEIISADPGIS